MSVTHQTLDISQVIPAPLDTVWAAFQDTTSRSVWSVPKGDDLVYSKDDFRPGGRASYRCGPSGDLNVAGEIEYIQIIPHELVVHTDTVSTGALSSRPHWSPGLSNLTTTAPWSPSSTKSPHSWVKT